MLDDLFGSSKAEKLLAAEEFARHVNNAAPNTDKTNNTNGVSKEPQKNVDDSNNSKTLTTKSERDNDRTIDSSYRFMNVEGEGKIEELLLDTDSNNYELFLYVDGRTVFDHDFSFFEDNGDLLEEVSVVSSGSGVKLVVSDLEFSEQFIVELRPQNTLNINEAFAKYKKVV